MVQAFLRRYGWKYMTTESGDLLSGFQSEKRCYPLKVSWTETWIRVEVSPLMRIEIEWLDWPELLKEVHAINEEISIAKLIIDEEGDLYLRLDLIQTELSYQAFCQGLEILGYYAEEIYDRVLDAIVTSGAMMASQQRHRLDS